MKNFKRILAVLLCALCLFTFNITASAAELGDSVNDAVSNWAGSQGEKEMVYTRPMFEHEKTIIAADLGLENFGSLYDIYAADGKIYILDSASGKIIITDENFNLINVISSVTINGEVSDFKDARGILVDEDNVLYIADTGHNRLLIGDTLGNVTTVLEKPDTVMWPVSLHYSPIKIVKDEMDYLYVLCEGSYHGAAMYTPDYEFKGFFGANSVSTSILDAMNNLWDMLFQNDVKISKSEKVLPFSFVDMELGPDGYIYTCTGSTEATASATGSVKKLNPIGTNILKDKSGTDVTDSASVMFATEEMIKYGARELGHDMASICIDENNFIYVCDVAYGRIYVYDNECNLITTIGGGVYFGSQDGTFKSSKAITTMNGKLYVVDAIKNNITVFGRNAYGDLVQTAQNLTIAGDYNDAETYWNKVLELDVNNILAYRGIAKAKLLQEDYHGALDYAKKGVDRTSYSRAYEYVRKDFLTKNFVLIVAIAVVLVVALILFLNWKKKKNIVLIKNYKLKTAISTLLHPADTFYEIKNNKGGSVLIATAFLAVWYVFKIIGLSTGFIFNDASIKDVNAWYALAQTFGLVVLFAVANWAVTTLFEGKGKLKDIYIVTSYSLIPMIIQAIGYDILSNVLTLNEANILTILNYVCIILTGVILVMGLINLHEFTFGKFVFTTIITVLAMILIVFLIFMILILCQQVKIFIETVTMELFFR